MTKAKKIDNISHLKKKYLETLKQSENFFRICLAFSENMSFMEINENALSKKILYTLRTVKPL